MSKFRMANETKFGMKPDPSRISYETLESKIKEILPTAAIWDTLGITEEEYYEKYPNKYRLDLNENNKIIISK